MWNVRWIVVAAIALCACGGPQGSGGSSGSCTASFGRPRVQGGLALGRVQRVLQHRAERIGRCLAHEPGEVSLTLRIVVPANGRPSHVLITEGVLTEQRTGDCLEQKIRQLRFPST